MHLSIQFQMSKKEREICELEMDFKKFFFCYTTCYMLNFALGNE